MKRAMNRSSKPKSEVKKFPFLCQVLKEPAMVEVKRTSIKNEQLQRYEPLRDEFLDCNAIHRCGLQTTDAGGKTFFDRDRCPAYVKIRTKNTLQ